MPHVLDFLEASGRAILLLMRTTAQAVAGAHEGSGRVLELSRAYMRMSSGTTVAEEGTDDRCVVRSQWIYMLARIMEYDDAHPDKRVLADHHVSQEELERFLAEEPEPLVGVSPAGAIRPSSSHNAELLRRAEAYLDARLAERNVLQRIDPDGE